MIDDDDLLRDIEATGFNGAGLRRFMGGPMPAKHGGKRQGAGSKRKLQGAISRSVRLEPQHLSILEKVRVTHGLPDLSAAMRWLIEWAMRNDPRAPIRNGMTLRPNREGYFPRVRTPFWGHVALGNGTQWPIQVILSDTYGVAIHVTKHGMACFGQHVHPSALRQLGIEMEGDRKNLADFINDQLGIVTGRYGTYMADLTS